VKIFISYIFVFISFSLVAQIRTNMPQFPPHQQHDTLDYFNKKDSLKIKLPKLPAGRYKIFTIENDTISVDTTLTIRDAYRFNQLFKDDFDYLPFSNIGHVLTQLSFDITDTDIIPGFVGQPKLTDYWPHPNIPFYFTPTPYSDLSYLNGMGQGQILNALFATNINKQLNVAANYRGLNSLGLYKNSVATSRRFLGSLNFNNRANTYCLKTYYYTYEKSNDENGGIANPLEFEQAGDIYSDRSRINVNLTDAHTQLKIHRLFVGQQYALVKQNLSLFNNLTYAGHAYKFEQKKATDLIGIASSGNGAVKDTVFLSHFQNIAGLKFQFHQLAVQSGIRYSHQVYTFDSLNVINNIYIPQKTIFNDLSLDNKARLNLGKLNFRGQLNIGFTKNIAGYYLAGQVRYKPNPQIGISGEVKSLSKRPDFKYLLYQSAYDRFNWNHLDFKNELKQKISAQITHQYLGKLTFNQILINNYTYFGADSLPHQNTSGIQYLSVKYQKDFYYKKWGLATDFKWQKVLQGAGILHLPGYILRGSLFFSDYYFQHNLWVQTGFTAKYFEAYYANAYNPVLSDFVLQHQRKIGGYPIIDYFLNFKIKRFRFYFKLAHLNALGKQKNPDYYAAPLQPYPDFNIRFGLRWIFFN